MAAVTVPLIAIVGITPRSRLLTVDLRGERFPFVAGQAVRLAPAGDGDGKPYSIACSPERVSATGRLELLIANDETTDLSWAQPGALAQIEGPLGTFTFPDPPDARRLLFVAGGTGIAPLRAMVRHARARTDGSFRLLYSARTPHDFAYRRELCGMARRGELQLTLTATRGVHESWRGERGRITAAQLAALIDDPATLCFVCGPATMVDEVPQMLSDLGIDRPRINVEEW